MESLNLGAHHWQHIFLTLRHPVNVYLLQCTTNVSGRLMCMFHWKRHWRRLCTETPRHGESAGSVTEEERCLGLRPKLTHRVNYTLGQQHVRTESPGLNDAVATLHDMGFSDGQITQLFALRPEGSSGIQQSLTTVSELLLLGLNIETVLKVVDKCPEVQRVTAHQLKDRTAYLRKLGLGEGSLQRVISYCPGLLTVPRTQAMKVVCCLKEQCLFTTQQVTEILRTCPWVLQEQPEDLEYKFQYAYFRLGIRHHQELVKTRLFLFPVVEIKYRHSFLERLGRYQTPDKKGQTQICNPKLKEVIGSSENAFLTKIARSTHEEFQVFRKLLDREEEEQINEEEDWDEDIEEQDEEENGSSDSASEGEDTFSDGKFQK